MGEDSGRTSLQSETPPELSPYQQYRISFDCSSYSPWFRLDRCATFFVFPSRSHLADGVDVVSGDGEVNGRLHQAHGVLDDRCVIRRGQVQLGRPQPAGIVKRVGIVAHEPEELFAEAGETTQGHLINKLFVRI